MTQLSCRMALSQQQPFATDGSRPKTVPPINTSHQILFKYVLTLPQLLSLTVLALILISNSYLHAKTERCHSTTTVNLC